MRLISDVCTHTQKTTREIACACAKNKKYIKRSVCSKKAKLLFCIGLHSRSSVFSAHTILCTTVCVCVCALKNNSTHTTHKMEGRPCFIYSSILKVNYSMSLNLLYHIVQLHCTNSFFMNYICHVVRDSKVIKLLMNESLLTFYPYQCTYTRP